MLFEKIDINQIVYDALIQKIGSAINYTELHRMIEGTISERKTEIDSMINDALDFSFNDEEFKKIVREEFRHKIAKNLVGKLEGFVEKSVSNYTQNPTMKAKMILALEEIVKSE